MGIRFYFNRPILLALGLACAGPARAQVPSANALGVLDAYLVQAARTDPAYRADIVIGGSSNRLPGRIPGYSAFLGPFDYRPKNYGELKRSDQAALLRDPAFHSYLAAARPAAGIPTGVGAQASPPARLREFSVTPAEMLAPATLQIVIPPP